MKNFSNTNHDEQRWRGIIAAAPYLAIILIFLAWGIYEVVKTRPDPLDDHTDRNRGIITKAIVVDSTYNGFSVFYATTNQVTKARLEEIGSRPHIFAGIERMKVGAVDKLGSLLNVDIYDFAAYAVSFDPDPDIMIHNIFVYGTEKTEQYIGPNPLIKDWAKWIDPNTSQGVQFINSKDIYKEKSQGKIYRYWKCNAPCDISHNDEKFSHFSESDRIR